MREGLDLKGMSRIRVGFHFNSLKLSEILSSGSTIGARFYDLQLIINFSADAHFNSELQVVSPFSICLTFVNFELT